jgi:hypothetical protein
MYQNHFADFVRSMGTYLRVEQKTSQDAKSANDSDIPF